MEAVLWIVGVLVLLVGVAISIGLHELGHYLPATRFGVYVHSFFIGFGPTLWHRRGKETVFGIKAVPLGGYVSLSGMYPPSANSSARGFRLFRSLVQEARDASAESIVDDSRAFYRLPVVKRIIIMLGGPFANLVIATVLYLLLFCGIGVVAPTTTVGSVSECVIPATSTRSECLATDPISPAAEAGLRVGDRVVSVGGTVVSEWNDATSIIRDNPGRTLEVVVDRAGESVTLSVTPIAAERYAVDDRGNVILDENGEMTTATVGFVGVGTQPARQVQTPDVAFAALGSNVVEVGRLIIDLPNRMVQVWNAAFGTEERDVNGPVSVVGVGRIAGDITAMDGLDVIDRLSALLAIVASLNIALFVFNLVPLLPLDGGHIAVALWESIRNAWAKVRGQKPLGPVDSARLVPVTIVMTVILMAMSALLIYADIVKPITLPL